MGRGDNKTRYLSEIRSMRGLCEARDELAIREWFARERLVDDAAEVLSLGTLVSLVSPRGSIVGRVAGGMLRGFSAARVATAVVKGAAKSTAKDAPAVKRRAEPRKAVAVPLKSGHATAKRPPAAKSASADKTVSADKAVKAVSKTAAAHVQSTSAAIKTATAKPVKAISASVKSAAVGVAKSATKSAKSPGRKSTPEIVVEVELDNQAKG